MKIDEIFWIIQKINVNAYKLELSFYWKIHNMFNTTHIQWACENPLSNQQCLMPFKPDSDEKFEVKEVLDSDMHNEHLMWLIKWINFNEFIWHQLSDFTEYDKTLKHFYNCYPDKSDEAHWHE